MNIFVKVTEQFGRGLYTVTEITKGAVLMKCELIVLEGWDSRLIQTESELGNYLFKYDNEKDCLVLGEGSLFNHSPEPNCGYMLEMVNGRKLMTFYALRHIQPEEQLFIDYTADDKTVNVEDYLKTKSLMG